jgi:PKD repeat protein
MTFDASNSGPSIAFFSWQFNDSDPGCTTCNNTIETTAPTITHTFPQPGAYDVGLAVLQADGLSQGVGGIVTTGQSGFTPGFTFAPAHPGRGESVTFTALATVSRLPVSNVLWEFGDGSSGSGLTPTHSYKKRGTYRVKAVLYSGVGSAFPGDGAAPVVEETVTVS